MEDPLAAESARVAAALLVQRCAFAISVGAPLYNCGDASACGDVYERTMRSCIQPSLPTEVRRIFEDALANSRLLVSASRKAWELRRALDLAVELATAIANATHSPATTTYGRSGRRGSVETPANMPAVASELWTSNARAAKSSSRREEREQHEQHDEQHEQHQVQGEKHHHHHHHRPLPAAVDDLLRRPLLVSVLRKKGRQEERPAQIIAMTLDDDTTGATPASHSTCHLLALPSDLIIVILGKLPGRALGWLSRSCTSLHRPALATAAGAVRRYQPSLFAGLGAEAHCSPHWTRCLHSIELLTEGVSASPAIPSDTGHGCASSITPQMHARSPS